ncbi:hypothetical protein GUY44_20645 [Pimelobacter simplex]|uniref:hypothetical protein n=1 Tax=Nocardioides simplex TaxID=2045 RepID=UPI00068EED44|nr:hypothetical protein [Pimelobacter simplex]MCG8152903.1 hypothetical protein [Pimelobacter simplex]GEB11872.1 hypothetical protein NSI01_01870 [Pimelobacter simplex]SFN02874.1 Mce-associated membrane protein [Pimelobacter simplex]
MTPHDVQDLADVEESTISDDERDRPDPVTGGGGNRTAIELGLAVLAAVVLVVGLVSWWRAGDHDAADVDRAQLRDTVLITARSHIETMNTLDFNDIDGGLDKWEDVSTGTLKDQIAATDAETRKLMAERGMISTGKVTDAAVVDLTSSTATVIASVETTVVDSAKPDQAPTVKRNRMAADLVKVGGRWLLEALDQVAVSRS